MVLRSGCKAGQLCVGPVGTENEQRRRQFPRADPEVIAPERLGDTGRPAVPPSGGNKTLFADTADSMSVPPWPRLISPHVPGSSAHLPCKAAS